MDPVFDAPFGVGGEYVPPPDKSITHRALMLGALSEGLSRIGNPLRTGDCLSTRRCLESLGCCFTETADELTARGVGLRGFREPRRVLDAENSGTTMRLLSGILAGQPLFAVMTGDDSLLSRPMGRIVEPLRGMGARIAGREEGRFGPLCFIPGTGTLRPIECELSVPSAQVKACLLLAALRADGPSRIGGRIDSRDHTERMLGALGVRVHKRDSDLHVEPLSAVPGFEIDVSGDVSSAAFFMTGALISGRELLIRNCGINPGRCGFLEVARRMGAEVEAREDGRSLGEPVGEVRVAPGELRGTRVAPSEIPELIDEVPLLAVLGMFARGTTEVRGAEELRFKESDRLAMIAGMAESLGGEIEVRPDGFLIEGPQVLRSGDVNPHGDHRIAMAAAVAGAGIKGGVRVRGFECARVSYPDFIEDFRALGGRIG